MNTRFNRKKSLAQKQIPTLLGLLILVGALASGLIFFGKGTGVFAPRATPQTTPKKVRITNKTDDSFTVSFYTDEATVGFIKYGLEPDKLNSQASDDRDQLSGTVEEYQLHHITLRGLEPSTTYYYVLGTGSNAEFDNKGEAFKLTTGAEIDAPPPNAKTVYGSVSTNQGNPAEGSIVYLSADGVADMSSLVKGSGSWAVPLAKARTIDSAAYADITEETELNIFVQGPSLAKTTQSSVKVAQAQPVEELVLGQAGPKQTQTQTADLEAATESATATDSAQTATDSSELADADLAGDEQEQQTSSSSSEIRGELEDLLRESAALNSTASGILILADSGSDQAQDAEPKVTTNKPKIKGKAKPNVEVKIEVHSDNQIESTVTANENGEFELDLASIEKGLEPGEHTVTYSYIDPDTGEEVIKTETFYVEDQTLALADTGDDSDYENQYQTTSTTTPSPAPSPTTQPYGSGNPYSMTTPSPTTSVVASASPTLANSSRSAVVSTDSALSKAGSVETTLVLVIAGLFFVLTGAWSWWLATEIDQAQA